MKTNLNCLVRWTTEEPIAMSTQSPHRALENKKKDDSIRLEFYHGLERFPFGCKKSVVAVGQQMEQSFPLERKE